MKKQWWSRTYARAMAVSAIAVAVSCTDLNSPSTVPLTDLRDLVEKMGYRPDMIIDRGNYFLVEGDIRIPKADLISRAYGQANQWREPVVVSSTEVTNISVSLDSLHFDNWDVAALDAMNRWNQIPGTTINFVEVTGAADIKIVVRDQMSYNGCTGATAHADAQPPTSGGQPGNLIRLNASSITCYSTEQKRYLIQHELGHTLGFRHTNWQQRNEPQEGAVQLTGYDPYSIMNGGILVSGVWAVPTIHVSMGDMQVAYGLWPEPVQFTSANDNGIGVAVLQPLKGAVSATLQYEINHQELDDYLMQQSSTIYEPLTTWSWFGATNSFGNADWTGYYACATPASFNQPSTVMYFVLDIEYPQITFRVKIGAPVMNPGGWQECYT